MLKNHKISKFVSDWLFGNQYECNDPFILSLNARRHAKYERNLNFSHGIRILLLPDSKQNKSMIAILKIISSLNHINIENRNCNETSLEVYQRDNIHLKTNVTEKAMSVFALIRIKIIFSLLFFRTYIHSNYCTFCVWFFTVFTTVLFSKEKRIYTSDWYQYSVFYCPLSFFSFQFNYVLIQFAQQMSLVPLGYTHFCCCCLSVCSSYCYEKKKTQDQTCNQDEWMRMFGYVIFTWNRSKKQNSDKPICV